MELRLTDEGKWFNRNNQGRYRPQSLAKDAALKEEIKKLLDANVIQPSQATHYSQVLLVPKPNGSWRLCIDYRSLNLALEGMGWPIPNIKELVNRIGYKQPKWFAVLDLTAGIHQVLLDENSRHLAAFITSEGVFGPVRISMGLKSAPPHFQQQMQNVALRELAGHICEVEYL